ncbi:ArsR/SmtB family transcription factor [Micromonospora eburnea]|uniref:ArsR/SmtB family transcription factor n=1 Tax=Micromonospora eburnea TaxID=227316 RepID=UPI001FC97301|nr:metalloregulator ArsR/SmtB family transcription factor [Micromonospora eburnea]
MSIESSFLARARIHAALGDPARLAIVDALTLGDASPGEIAQTLDLPTNLVAHHVKVLTDAELVTKGRSEGDRRRTYLRLRPETLATLATPRLTGVGRVVFVCTHNSARSQLAAALWKRRTHRAAASAGTQPAPGCTPARWPWPTATTWTSTRPAPPTSPTSSAPTIWSSPCATTPTRN